ncbi:MAG: site-specific integrase [Clostridia bacterium]|nr:site-specific integrase [Clostridia bacterium]
MVAGHLQEKKGYFYMVLSYSVGGKRKTKWIPTGMAVKGNKKKAEALLMETRQNFEPEPEEVAALSGEIMFVDFLTMWLEIAKSTIKLTTYASYADMTNKTIIPYFKPLKRKLSELTAADIQKFYLVQLERVSANSVIHYHAIIHRAMKYAVKTDLIVSNPVDKVDRPKKNSFQGSFYTEDEIQDLFEAAKGTKLELPIVLAAFYGLRRSEVLGLKWDAIDFQQNTITIKHTLTSCKIDGKKVEVATDTTKTKSSRRTLPLIPQFREMLLQRWEMQEEYKRVCGNCYNTKYLDYICVDEMGNIIPPNYVTEAFPKLLARHGMRHIRFHDLRHTCASMLLKNGVPMKQIQEWLGHSDFSTTANIYAHLDYNSKLNSAEAMVTGMKSALNSVC